MPVGPGCWCGMPNCTVCPDVEPRKPDATMIRIDGELTGDQVKAIRQFASGASRDSDEGKLDFEAYLSPLVLLRYAEYMKGHQVQSDGQAREGDNWQKGIPTDAYMKSLVRHVFDVWLLRRGKEGVATQDIETALCAVLFNTMGLLFNILEGKE